MKNIQNKEKHITSYIVSTQSVYLHQQIGTTYLTDVDKYMKATCVQEEYII
jgi:hypothetical protein